MKYKKEQLISMLLFAGSSYLLALIVHPLFTIIGVIALIYIWNMASDWRRTADKNQQIAQDANRIIQQLSSTQAGVTIRKLQQDLADVSDQRDRWREKWESQARNKKVEVVRVYESCEEAAYILHRPDPLKDKYQIIDLEPEPDEHAYKLLKNKLYKLRKRYPREFLFMCGPYVYNKLQRKDKILPLCWNKEKLIEMDVRLQEGETIKKPWKKGITKVKKRYPVQGVDLWGWHPEDGA